jgi:hypothetical protein
MTKEKPLMTLKDIREGLTYHLRQVGYSKNRLCEEGNIEYASIKHDLCNLFILLDYLDEHIEEAEDGKKEGDS